MKKFYTHKIKINKEQNHKRLDQALTKLLGTLTRTQIKNLIVNKAVKKNNYFINEASHKVKEGEIYSLTISKIENLNYEGEEIPLNIIYEDQDIIVINKNPGIVTHPAPGNRSGTLVNALINHSKNELSTIGSIERPGIVHRLDKDTSGLMVIAKNNISHLKLSEQFKNHSISRKYKAIVWGVPQSQIIKGYIERNKINRKKMSLNKNERGKFSETNLKIIKNFGIYSIVQCTLKTGRTHQVRLHLTSVNSPVVGDNLYGKNKINKFSKNKETFNQFLILKNFKRQALHAFHLGFKHPKSSKYIEFESDFPKDIENLLEKLLKY